MGARERRRGGSSVLVVFADQDSGLQRVQLSPDGAVVGGPFAIASNVAPSSLDITPPGLSIWLDNNELYGAAKAVRGTRLCTF